MSITCEVKVSNKSGAGKHYLIFMDAPNPTNGPSGQVFFNVYDRSPNIESGNNAFVKWDCTSDFYALYGTTQTTPDGNTKVETGASTSVKLGPGGTTVGLIVEKDGSPRFDKDSLPPSPAKGGFTFQTNAFPFPNKFHTYIGIGAPNPRGSDDDIRPLQTYEAEPSLKSQLFPKLTYYICTGEYESGTLVDRNTIGEAIKLEFTGAAIPAIELYQNNAGNYAEVGTDRVMTTTPYTTDNGVTVSVSPVNG